ncbi:MAG: iron hydrogenase small subunit, partial [Candidatus Omnitrophica bacterium]|nr:iron hydrogenase small subunit [Candidatus Omnitrophota bacterium]
SIMPCTAKKYEIKRSKHMYSSGYQDTDIVITTRELIRMIKQAGVEFLNLPEEKPDHILGDYTGAGTIFGVTGGVMEAALRTAYHLITKKELGHVEFENVRGLKGVKETTVFIEGTEIRIAVAHGLGNVESVINRIREAKKKGEMPYHFVEVMACQGGCIGGGGQPYGITDGVRDQRTKGLYSDDEKSALRCSHHNPYVKALYDEFLERPLSHKSHELLHTHYVPKPEYKK